MINCFLLFHKCGNNYIREVHRKTKNIDFREIKAGKANKISQERTSEKIINFRCRNFSASTLIENDLLDIPFIKFVFFTRHPISFIKSAAKYHSRGPEAEHRELTKALLATKGNLDLQQIIIMKYFKHLYDHQTSLMQFADDKRFLRVKCEELFTTKNEYFFKDLQKFLRLENDINFLNALKSSSLAFKKVLPSHSTESFRDNKPLGAEAQSYYNEHWKHFEDTLGY